MAVLQLSPSHLNNRGVLLLESGRHEDSARIFKKAAEMIVSFITSQRDTVGDVRTDNDGGETSRRAAADEPLSLSSPSSMIGILGGSSHQPRDLERTATGAVAHLAASGEDQPLRLEDPAPPRKRGSREEAGASSLMTVPSYSAPPSGVKTTMPTHVLGRPMWIRPKEERQGTASPPLDSASLASTLLYNLGLSLHMIANTTINDNKSTSSSSEIDEEQQHQQQQLFYTKSLEVYQKALDVIGPSWDSTAAGALPVVVALLHNMSRARAALGEGEAAGRPALAGVLRRMVGLSLARSGDDGFDAARNGDNNNNQRYEIAYIRFLSCSDARDSAAAAA